MSLARLLLLLHAATTLGTLAAAGYLLSLRCEGFGCTGVGVAWLAWAGLMLLPALLLGAWAWRRQPQAGARRAAVGLLALLAAAALLLLGLWLRSA